MNILILSDDFPPRSFGGAGIIAFNQARELVRRGHEVTVITSSENKKDENETSFEGLIVHTLYSSYPASLRAYFSVYNPKVIKKIKKIMRNTKPDIIHAHNLHQHLSFRSLALARIFSKKVFLTAHDAMLIHYSKIFPKMTTFPDGQTVFDYRVSLGHQIRYFWRQWNPFRKIAISGYLKNVDKILAVSGTLRDALEQNGIKKVHVMHNGVNVEDYKVSTEELEKFKTIYNLNGKKVLFFGGRLGKAKGGDVALKLYLEIVKTIPNAVLLIAGKEDAYAANLKNKANAGGVSDGIRFTGWLDRSEIKSAYHASDVILTLSLYLDPFPTVNLEAMASAKPVIGTCFGGTPEVVLNDETGFIVDPRNLESVASYVKKILTDNNLKERLGEAGYRRIKERFSLSRQIDELEKIYAGK